MTGLRRSSRAESGRGEAEDPQLPLVGALDVGVIDRPDPYEPRPDLGAFGVVEWLRADRDPAALVADLGLRLRQQVGRPGRVVVAAEVAAHDDEPPVVLR